MAHSLLRCIMLASACFQAVAAAPASFQNHYVSLGSQDHSVAIAADISGNIFTVANITDAFGQQALRISKSDPQGNLVASFDFDQGVMGYYSGLASVSVAADPQGNAFVAANMLGYTVRVVKLDAALTRIVANTTLGGTMGGTSLGAIATDVTGNLYVAGVTRAADFPVTPGAYRTAPPTPGASPGFVSKFTNDLSTLLYSSLYGDDRGSGAPARLAKYAITAILVDSNGAATIGGYFNTPNGTELGASQYAAFIARLSPDGASITASTTFGGVDSCVGSRCPAFDSAKISVMAFDPAGNVLVGGFSMNVSFPSTPQPHWPANGGFVARFDPNLQNLTAGTLVGGWSNMYGGEIPIGVTGIASDADGNIWFTGSAPQSTFMGQTTYTPLTPYVAAISNDWTTFLHLTPTPVAGRAITGLPGGGIAVLGPNDSFLTSSPDLQPGILMVTNSATNTSSGTIAPTELMTLYGTGIGPAEPIPGQVIDGVFTKALGGYQVLFNGAPVPLLYAGPDQFNVVSPLALREQRTARIQVMGPKGTIDFPTVYVAPARPQIFSYLSDSLAGPPGPSFGVRYAISLNEDGTMNSSTNPARSGSVVTIWVSGAFGTSSVGQRVDGEIVPKQDLVPYPSVAVAVTDGGPPYHFLDVRYASDAPGQILGLTQVNLVLPMRKGIQLLPYQEFVDILIGGVASDGVGIFATTK